MKRIALALVICLAIASLACAEVLVTANPMGKGQMGWLAGGRYDMSSVANQNSYSAGGYLGYGLMDNLDLYGKLGYGIGANPLAGQTINGIMAGAALKYTFVKEGKDMPVTLAVAGGYQSTTTTVNAGASMQMVTGDLGIGIIASKVMVPYVPYGAVNYHSLNSNAPFLGTSTGSMIEIAGGTQLLLSKSTAVIGELCYQSITSGGATTNNTQVSLAYSAKI